MTEKKNNLNLFINIQNVVSINVHKHFIFSIHCMLYNRYCDGHILPVGLCNCRAILIKFYIMVV